jgi:ATP-dependent protease HslVU (ClpYQ) peptidase subunit
MANDFAELKQLVIAGFAANTKRFDALFDALDNQQTQVQTQLSAQSAAIQTLQNQQADQSALLMTLQSQLTDVQSQLGDLFELTARSLIAKRYGEDYARGFLAESLYGLAGDAKEGTPSWHRECQYV